MPQPTGDDHDAKARSDAILALPIIELANELRRGNLTAVEVLHTYRKRAELIDGACNCILCYCNDAEEEAEKADEHFRRTGGVLGLLHGVPFSVKDNIQLRGTPTFFGLQTAKQRYEAAIKKGKQPWHKVDEPLVTALRNCGAIPFAKTSMCQLGFTWGSGSLANGDTLNPWDTRRISGGSSSGEGALVGGGASPFGIGNDIGGSLRIPSNFCGLCTLKPTCGRLSMIFSEPGDYSITSTSGFMTRHVEDLEFLHACILADGFFALAPTLVRAPWDQHVTKSSFPLQIGYYVEEYTTPAPCHTVRRAMEEVVEALRRQGHKVVPFTPQTDGVLRHQELAGLVLSFALATRSPRESPDDGKPAQLARDTAYAEAAAFVPPGLEQEPLHPDIVSLYGGGGMPRVEEGVEYIGDQNAAAFLQLMHKRDMLRQRFYKAWSQAGLDILVCPVWPLPASRVEETAQLGVLPLTSTRVFNFFDMPAGVVPVTRVTKEDLQHKYEDPKYPVEVGEMVRKSLKGSEGLPVAVQVVALPWREELAIRGMQEVAAQCALETRCWELTPTPRRTPNAGEPAVEVEVVSNYTPVTLSKL